MSINKYLIFTSIMILQQALNEINLTEKNIDRQQVLAKTLKNPEKLAKTLLRIEFLTACRRNKVSPRFIEDALNPLRKVFQSNASIQSRCSNLSSSILNDVISESFKTKAFLLRQRDQLTSNTSGFLDEDRRAHIYFMCDQIFNETIYTNRPRLVKKYQSLMKKKDDRVSSETNVVDPSPGRRVNNLSSLDIDGQKLKLLSRGPNYAMNQEISETVLLEVEKGVERFAYAKRWKDAIKRFQSAPLTTNTPTRDERTEDLHQPVPPTAVLGEVMQANKAQTVAPNTRKTTGDANNAEDGVTPAANNTVNINESEATGHRAAEETPQTNVTATSARSTNGGTAPIPTEATREKTDNTGLSFRFADTDKRYPPPSNIEVELTLKKLKEDIIRTYKSHRTSECNVTSQERQFLKELQKNDDIIIKQSDKCKGFVVMDRTAYVEKVHNILGDINSYETMDKNPVAKVEAQTKRIFKSVSKDKMTESTVKELTPNHSRTPVFYGLPKDHKPSVPLRPVISGCDGPTQKTSCLLERILKQLLKFVPTHLWNTQDFLNRMRTYQSSNGVPENAIFFSIDVVNLYGSIPLDEAITAVSEKLQTHLKDVDTFGLSPDDVKVLMEQCLNNNVFRFDSDYYRQKLGIAMGNPCAPPVAILFLDRFERQHLETVSEKPDFLVRYVDDYAGIWTHGEQALLDFVAHMNTVHETVKFTLEVSKDVSGVPFLDTVVTIEENNGRKSIETELYIKPTNSGIILHYDSAHPKMTKHNVAREQFKRAIRNSSTTNKEKKSIDKVWKLLLENGYPKHVLSRVLREARTPKNAKKYPKQKDIDGFLCLPFIDDHLLCKVKRKVVKSGLNINVAWQNKSKLKTVLVHSSFSKPKCPGGQRCHTCNTGFKGDCSQKNVVYKISCKLCQEKGEENIYIGETKRPLRLRFNEHIRDAVNRTQETPMGDHFLEHHPSHPQNSGIPLNIQILYRAKDHPDRKIAESVFIKKRRPQLNRNSTSWPIL